MFITPRTLKGLKPFQGFDLEIFPAGVLFDWHSAHSRTAICFEPKRIVVPRNDNWQSILFGNLFLPSPKIAAGERGSTGRKFWLFMALAVQSSGFRELSRSAGTAPPIGLDVRRG